MRETKLPDLFEDCTLNYLTRPRQSNRQRPPIHELNKIVLFISCIHQNYTCVWNTDINAETWSETYQLKVRATNQMNTIESPGYHHWKSALIADNSQKKSIYFNRNTPRLLLKRTILPSKPLWYRYWTS